MTDCTFKLVYPTQRSCPSASHCNLPPPSSSFPLSTDLPASSFSCMCVKGWGSPKTEPYSKI